MGLSQLSARCKSTLSQGPTYFFFFILLVESVPASGFVCVCVVVRVWLL